MTSCTATIRHGVWAHDDCGLPCFEPAACRYTPNTPELVHLMGTGRLSAFVDRWGGLRPFTTEGGSGLVSFIERRLHNHSAVHAHISTDSSNCSLIPGYWAKIHHVRYGVGYAEFCGLVDVAERQLGITMAVCMPPHGQRYAFVWYEIDNSGNEPIGFEMSVGSDCLPVVAGKPIRFSPSNEFRCENGAARFEKVHESIGGVCLTGPSGWSAGFDGHTLLLKSRIQLVCDERVRLGFAVSFGADTEAPLVRKKLAMQSPQVIRNSWKDELAAGDVQLAERWVRDECVWANGQLLSFTNYDSSVGEFYVALGGYGWGDFGIRECPEVSLCLAPWKPELAKSCLRWAAKLQYSNGDIPKTHDFCRHEKDIPQTPVESDNEIWFVLGCMETAQTLGDASFLNETCFFQDGPESSIWDHCKAAFEWVRDKIGIGSHGLIHISRGDWNDYLGTMGRDGRGESVMNSAMACRAFSLLEACARRRGETDFATHVHDFVVLQREAVAGAFDETHFLRGYTDAGKPVGGIHDDRVFINAQSWAALGQCGTLKQRKTALLKAVESCWTPIGLSLMSRPYPVPAPREITHCDYPEGDGENAGVWPQTVFWMVWALAEHGLIQQAWEVWKAMSLRNHAQRHPDVPFGIFNGSDCYSSLHVGSREGWTQLSLIDRESTVPMNPMVAWQTFALRKILDAGGGYYSDLDALHGQVR